MSEKGEAEGGGRGFVVVDRRASAGAADEPSPERGEPAPTGAPGSAPPAGAAAPPSPAGAAAPPPRVDFAMLVQSFFVSALYHMGLAPDPEGGRAGELDLSLARQNIDILEMIQEKMRGNLDAEEARLLEGLLYEVRMRFVEATQARRA